MNPAIKTMLNRYSCKTAAEYANALKEIMQEIALLGLWRAKFFDQAAFYGGTALRIVHQLDRFSEDLDFTLLKNQKYFKLAPFFSAIQAELGSMGFKVEIKQKDKATATAIDSAFIKAGTKEHLILIQVPKAISDHVQKNTTLTIKLEVDTDPPGEFRTEAKTLLLPIPFTVLTLQLPDLFAGKIHAVLARNWKGSRVKGRDFYDFIWYISRNVPVRLRHLEARLRQSGHWQSSEPFRKEQLINLLQEKLKNLDVNAARRDVAPFIRDSAALNLWSSEFFTGLLDRLNVID